ncbi:MAG: AMP-binding protein [Rhodospirillaceae bacterium]
MTTNLFEIFRTRFPTDSARAFITRPDGRVFSYADLDEISGRIAALLIELNVAPGDRVAMQVEKSAEAVFLYLACLRAGAVFLPMNTGYRTDELDYFIADAEPTLVVADPGSQALMDVCTARKVPQVLTLDAHGQGTLMNRAASLAPLGGSIARAGTDLAAILYSSGTTGKPKGVMLSHGNLASNAKALHEVWKFGPDDVLLHTLPIFHVHGLFVALNTVLMNGTGMIFHSRFTPEETIRDLPQATVFMGVPTYYVRLLANCGFKKEAARNVRLFISGSAPLLDETFRAFEDRTGKQILERYGMTEACIITSAHIDRARTAGAVGWPLPGLTLRVADETNQPVPNGTTGEIQIKGPSVFRGYWRKPEKTAEDFTVDGFFKTGDLAQLDPDGMVNIVGRAKDMMICGGYNVYPKEIETVIDGLPGVAESAVVGMPHPDFGEAGLAIITMNAGAPALSPDTVRAALKDALASFKVPKMIVFADALPRNTMGKVQKNVLRQDYRAAWDTGLKA